MLIVLEGHEAVFKTTVAEKVHKKLGLPIIKGSSFELSTATNKELFRYFKECAQKDNVIYDRFIYSNQTYATIYSDYTILSDKQRNYIEGLIKDKAIIYYLFADDETIKKRIQERGDDYVDVSMVGKINKLFHENISKSPLRVVWYDTTEWDSDSIAKEIIDDYIHQVVKRDKK